MTLQEFLTKLSLASCPHGRTRGPYTTLCDHLEMLHKELQKNPHFAAALAEEEEEEEDPEWSVADRELFAELHPEQPSMDEDGVGCKPQDNDR